MGAAVSKHLHLIKLSVGSDSVEAIADWQRRRSAQTEDGQYFHLTRMWPRREAELLDGGSIYWVVKGLIQCRQRIARLESMTGRDGVARCAMFLDSEIIRTGIVPKRPFQGWRYLRPEDAPHDLPPHRQAEEQLPAHIAGMLDEIGVV